MTRGFKNMVGAVGRRRMPEDRSKCTIDGAYAEKQTERALLVESTEYAGWVPLSVIRPESDVQEEGDDGDLVVKGWWAKKNGLEVDDE